MTVLQGVLLFGATVIAGGMNSVAGGGSFILFPAILSIGIPSINANATNTISLWPGSAVSIAPYRKELAKQDRRRLVELILVSMLGGFLGAELLRNTPAALFDKILPFLLLVATLLFTFSKRITTMMNRVLKRPLVSEDNQPSAVAVVLQLVIATYGGYFGGGIGVLMLTACVNAPIIPATPTSSPTATATLRPTPTPTSTRTPTPTATPTSPWAWLGCWASICVPGSGSSSSATCSCRAA